MKIIFMGTPEFAVGALEAILAAGHEVACVVTQPDKPKGRGKQLQAPPVKECAMRHGLKVFQPLKIKTPEAVEQLRQYGAQLFVVAAFGQILSQEILDLPRFGCVNIHASLLPKYRGAAPIQKAILDGETETGVTIMQMDAGLDTGAMLAKCSVPILPEDTGDSLEKKLSRAGAELIVKTLPLLERGGLEPVPQNDAQSCYAGMLRKSMGKIDWSRPAAELERLVRAFDSRPGAYALYGGKTLKIRGALAQEGQAEPGVIAAVEKDNVKVGTGEGLLCLTAVQPEGKRRMAVRDFLLGYPMKPGERLN